MTHIAFGYYLHSKRWYTVQVLSKSEDAMSTQLDPTQLAMPGVWACIDPDLMSRVRQIGLD
ncbi:hypothetical protein EA251_01580 [Escherichia coli]|nr:hypothetical protein EA251_01580 [Escherichia coli]